MYYLESIKISFSLRNCMYSPQEAQIRKRFDRIKINYKKYIEAHMISKMDELRKSNPDQIIQIESYATKIKDYRSNQEVFLDRTMQQPSFASEVGNGALAALAGFSTGGVASLFHQSITPTALNFVPGLTMVNQALGSFFSLTLGLGASYLVYQALKAKHPDLANDSNALEKALKTAGFDNSEKYQDLAFDLIKLFHYRECLLLNLNGNGGQNVRDQFKKGQFKPEAIIDEELLNQAIEVYFIQELNNLFNQAFKNIYQIHDEIIEKDANVNEILKWLSSFFSDPSQRQVFTEQLQIEFMTQCVKYLLEKQEEPGFFIKHRIAISSFNASAVGLLTTSVTFMVLSAVGVTTFGVGIAIPLALLAATAVGIGVFALIGKIEWFKYKRGEENRKTIGEAINHIDTEKNRLKKLVKQVTHTTIEEKNHLKKYSEASKPNGYFSLFLNYFLPHKKSKPLMGSPIAWSTEYASRYRHSKMIENDLGDDMKSLIKQADSQTRKKSQMLYEIMKFKADSESRFIDLDKMVSDTRDFLRNEDQKAFIQSFNLHAKLRQQCLEIVAAIPRKDRDGSMLFLPESFIQFYTFDLKGNAQDLEQVRRIGPIHKDDVLTEDFHHPLQSLLIHSRMLDELIPRPLKHVLQGDLDYREKLGLATVESGDITDSISTYLTDSFDFLLSLSQATSIDGSLQYKEEFTIYKTLLFKQLATLSDPNNFSINSDIKEKIITFVQNKFQLTLGEVKEIFDAIINQSLFFDPEASSEKLTNSLGIEVEIAGLNHVAEAIRLNMASISTPITARNLILSEAISLHLNEEQRKSLFFNPKDSSQLIPSKTEAFLGHVRQTIHNSKILREKLATAEPESILRVYLNRTIENLNLLLKNILRADKLMPPLCDEASNPFPLPLESSNITDGHLKESLIQLEQYKNELQSQLASLPETTLSESFASSLFLSRWVCPDINEMISYQIKILNDYLKSLGERLTTHTMLDALLFFNRTLAEKEAQELCVLILQLEEFRSASIEERQQTSYDLYVTIKRMMKVYKESTPLVNALSDLCLLFNNEPPEPRVTRDPNEEMMVHSNYFLPIPPEIPIPGDDSKEYCSISDILKNQDRLDSSSSSKEHEKMPISSTSSSSVFCSSSVVLIDPKTSFIALLESCLATIDQPLPTSGWWLAGFFSTKEKPYDKEILNTARQLLERLQKDKNFDDINLSELNADQGPLGKCIREGLHMISAIVGQLAP